MQIIPSPHIDMVRIKAQQTIWERAERVSVLERRNIKKQNKRQRIRKGVSFSIIAAFAMT